MKITAHCLVKNEARFVWFALNSIADFVDQILIFDTGSRDGTWEILQEFKNKYPNKTKLTKYTAYNFNEEEVRLLMLKETSTDWFMVLDGDEIWWRSSIQKAVEEINKNGKDIESIVIPTINLVGDMYHYQPLSAGNYHLAGRVGHYNLRFINTKIPGLSSEGAHGVWGWVDGEGKMIQDRDAKKIMFIDAPYLHATHLQRSGERSGDIDVYKRENKLKHEIGIEFPKDYFYPEAFFVPKSDKIPFVWEPMTKTFYMQSMIETPLRQLKRKLLPKKIGY